MNTAFKFQKKIIIDAIANGEVVALPTDTVFGLACHLTNEKAYEKILLIKGREPQKEMAVLISDPKQIEPYAEITPKAIEYISKYWPGALTIVLKKKQTFTHQFFEHSSGLGFRMPDNEWLRAIIHRTGPIFATSANISGKLPLENWKDIVEELQNVDLVVRENIIATPPSTVVDLRGHKPKILRKGALEV